jgi:uncharacterized protein (TIGR02217 family)
MPFCEQRLPLRLDAAFSGSIERRTDIVALASGFEARSTPWAHGRRRYLVDPGARSPAEAAELVAFFEARRGRLEPFRFPDFTDERSCAPGGEIGPLDQPIGTGDGHTTAFQLVKAYGAAPDTYLRPIRKPVAGTTTIAVNGTATTSGWSVDTTTGLVSFTTAPAIGAAITAGFGFDTPVRFDIDALEVKRDGSGAVRVAPFALVEVRV